MSAAASAGPERADPARAGIGGRDQEKPSRQRRTYVSPGDAHHARLERLAQRDVPLGPQVRQLLTLLDLYGHGVLELAVAAGLERDTPHAASIARLIDKLVKPADATAPLPDTGRREVDELTIKHHNLEDYDAL